MKTARVLLGFGALVSLAAGCNVYDKSLLGSAASCAPNTIGCLPSPPADRTEPDGGGNQTSVWALTSIDLNQQGSDWTTQGLDLDGIDTSASNLRQGCTPASGTGIPTDGQNGIDNAYGQALYTTTVSVSIPKLSDQLCCWGRRGRGTILVRVDDWNGTKNDPKVRLSVLYAADGTSDADALVHWDQATEHGLVHNDNTPAALPSWTVDSLMDPPMTPTRWWIDPASYVAGMSDNPYVTDANAYIRDGFVSMRLPGDQPITLMIGDDTSLASDHGRGGSLKITLQGAYAWAQLSDDLSHIVRGGMAGRLGKTQLLSVASSLGVCIPISAIEYLIDQYGDVHLNPLDDSDPTSNCDAVSFGTTFQGVRGTLAGTAPEGLCLADACGKVSCSTYGSDHGQCGNASTPIPTCAPLAN